MEELNLNDHLAHQRWLINNGFINDLHKDTLYMHGAILHKDIQAVHLRVRQEQKVIEYDVYIASKLIRKISDFHEFKKSDGVYGLWKFKRMLKKEGNLDLEFIADKFVKDYCGPQWTASVKINNIANYKDGLEEEKNSTDAGFDFETDKLSN